jgi:hypothetical protein
MYDAEYFANHLSLPIATAYLDAAGHGADIEGPLFRPLKHNGKRQDECRRMDPDAIDRVVRIRWPTQQT